MDNTAVYVLESSEVKYQVIAGIAADNTLSGNVITFVVSWEVPAGAGTFVKGGILFVAADKYDASTFVVGTTDGNVTQASPSKAQAADQPGTALTKKDICYPGTTWITASWVQYKDAKGVIHTVYSDLLTVTKL